MAYIKTFLKWLFLLNVGPFLWVVYMGIPFFDVMDFTFDNIVGTMALVGLTNLIPSITISLFITFYYFLKENINESKSGK